MFCEHRETVDENSRRAASCLAVAGAVVPAASRRVPASPDLVDDDYDDDHQDDETNGAAYTFIPIRRAPLDS
jgi:hypothetical protein